MVKRPDSVLQGMAEIRAYVNRAEATVLRWIRELGLPARKLAGGTWESDKALIDESRKEQLSSGTHDPQETSFLLSANRRHSTRIRQVPVSDRCVFRSLAEHLSWI